MRKPTKLNKTQFRSRVVTADRLPPKLSIALWTEIYSISDRGGAQALINLASNLYKTLYDMKLGRLDSDENMARASNSIHAILLQDLEGFQKIRSILRAADAADLRRPYTITLISQKLIRYEQIFEDIPASNDIGDWLWYTHCLIETVMFFGGIYKDFREACDRDDQAVWDTSEDTGEEE